MRKQKLTKLWLVKASAVNRESIQHLHFWDKIGATLRMTTKPVTLTTFTESVQSVEINYTN